MFVDEKPQGEQAPVKVGTLKLSEAIRIGAKLRGQCQGSFFEQGRSCAMGAVLEAHGVPYSDDGVWVAAQAFAILPNLMSRNGNGYCYTPLAKEIYHRNDSGDTREQIADWLERKGL